MREDMKMKINKLIYIAAALLAFVACVQNPAESEFSDKFGVDQEIINVGAPGGPCTFKVSAAGRWVAMTESPWITVSPANGKGNEICTIQVDSTLLFEERVGMVRIQSLEEDDDKANFSVIQEGFEYQITLDEVEKNIAEYDVLEKRNFEVKVKANVDFDVVLPGNSSNWLTYEKSKLNLDRKARPRRVNSSEKERIAEIEFRPKEEVVLAKHDVLKVVQHAAPKIPVGTPAGDSLAILAVSRALGSFTEWDVADRMEHWNNVEIWHDGEHKGRVRYV